MLTLFDLQDTVLLANATFPSSGNFCFNVSVPNASSLQTGARGTLYVESSDLDGDDEDDGHSHGNVSSCAGTQLLNRLLFIMKTDFARHHRRPVSLCRRASCPKRGRTSYYQPRDQPTSDLLRVLLQQQHYPCTRHLRVSLPYVFSFFVLYYTHELVP